MRRDQLVDLVAGAALQAGQGTVLLAMDAKEQEQQVEHARVMDTEITWTQPWLGDIEYFLPTVAF